MTGTPAGHVTTSQVLKFTVEGNPLPKARPRIVLRRDHRAQAYTPARTRAWEQQIGWAARQAMQGRRPFRGPLELVLYIYRANARRADADNIEKAAADAMTGIVYEDDDQIIDCHRYKRIDRDHPRLTITVTELQEMES